MTERPDGLNGVPLAEVVEKIWYCQIDGAEGQEILLPTGRAQLVFGLHPSSPLAIIQGPMTKPTAIGVSAQRLAVGVSFRPGGLYAITGESAASFTDRHIEANDVFGCDLTSLSEELADAPARGQATSILEQFLAERVRRSDRLPSSEVTTAIAGLRRGQPVATACHLAETKRTRLVSAFRTEIGMTPKLFGRLLRFEAAVARVRSAEAESLSSISARTGFADQAHMTREFARFAGRTPGSLHRDHSTSPNHLRFDVLFKTEEVERGLLGV